MIFSTNWREINIYLNSIWLFNVNWLHIKQPDQFILHHCCRTHIKFIKFQQGVHLNSHHVNWLAIQSNSFSQYRLHMRFMKFQQGFACPSHRITWFHFMYRDFTWCLRVKTSHWVAWLQLVYYRSIHSTHADFTSNSSSFDKEFIKFLPDFPS